MGPRRGGRPSGVYGEKKGVSGRQSEERVKQRAPSCVRLGLLKELKGKSVQGLSDPAGAGSQTGVLPWKVQAITSRS